MHLPRDEGCWRTSESASSGDREDNPDVPARPLDVARSRNDGGSFFSLLGALSIYDVSFVVPVTALSYVAGAFGGVVFLREHVGFQRWLGVSLVAIGVALVFLGKN